MGRRTWQNLTLKIADICVAFILAMKFLMRLYEIFETSKKQDLTPFKNHLPSISFCDYNQKTLSGE